MIDIMPVIGSCESAAVVVIRYLNSVDGRMRLLFVIPIV